MTQLFLSRYLPKMREIIHCCQNLIADIDSSIVAGTYLFVSWWKNRRRPLGHWSTALSAVKMSQFLIPTLPQMDLRNTMLRERSHSQCVTLHL